MRKLIYFSIATSFFAAQIFTINLSSFQLSLFRVAILIMPYLLILYSLRRTIGIYIIPTGENRFSIKFMIYWLIYSLISLIWVENYSLAFRSLYFILAGVLCAVVFSIFLKDKKHFSISFNVIQLMILLHNIIGWYEIFTRDYRFLSLDNVLYYSSIDRGIPISMMGNPNDFATLAIFGVVISFICMKINKTHLAKNFSKVLLVSNIILIFLSESRANILGLLLAISVYLILSKKTKSSIYAGVFILLSVSFLLLRQDILANIIYKISEVLNFNFNTDNLNSEGTRLNLIRNGMVFLKDTFGFGTGVGNIEYWMQYKAVYPTREVTNIHNWWMEILVGYGVLTFFLYLLFYFKLYKSMIKVYKKTHDSFDRSVSLGILVFMTAFIIASLSSSSNIAKEWLWVFWSLCIAFQGYATKKL